MDAEAARMLGAGLAAIGMGLAALGVGNVFAQYLQGVLQYSPLGAAVSTARPRADAPYAWPLPSARK